MNSKGEILYINMYNKIYISDLPAKLGMDQ